MIRAGGEGSGDWKELYRVLVTSLRTSSVHFEQLTVEAATVGLWGLAQAHAKAQIHLLEGQQLGPADRAAVTDWVCWADLLLRAFSDGGGNSTAAELAASLSVPESCVLHYVPQSQPMLPSHALVADTDRQQLLLLVRGTSTWADCLTDLVAHTSPLGAGQCHSGMLECARGILGSCLPLMQQHLQQHPGYRIHCLGHSLGGGVAALAAYLMRHEGPLREQLAGASGVMATGFGTPPVMTRELAEASAAWTRTLVHNADLVPRTCVASLEQLRAELQAEAAAVYGSNALLSRLRDSGVVDKGLAAFGSLCSAAVAGKMASGVAAAAVSKSPAMQRWVSAGLQVGAGLLVSQAKQLHEQAMAGAPASGGSSSGRSGSTAPPTSAATSAPSTATGVGGAAGGKGMFSFAAMAQAVSAVGTAAAAAQQQQQQPSCASTGGTARAGPQAAGVAAEQQARYEEEEQAATVHLYCPGEIWHLVLSGDGAAALQGAAAAAEPCYTLVRAPRSCGERFGAKIWVRRSMLSDHFLSEHVQALLRLQAQLVEQACCA